MNVKSLIASVALIIVAGADARGQGKAPAAVQQSNGITGVTLDSASASPASATNCSHKFMFYQFIHIEGGPGEVQYTWERSDHGTMQPKVYHVRNKGGSVRLDEPWSLGTDPGKTTKVWERLHILSPVDKQGPEIPVTLNCIAKKSAHP